MSEFLDSDAEVYHSDAEVYDSGDERLINLSEPQTQTELFSDSEDEDDIVVERSEVILKEQIDIDIFTILNESIKYSDMSDEHKKRWAKFAKDVKPDKNGRYEVKYSQKSICGISGRMFGNGSQSLPRQIKGSLISNLYYDVDIVNSGAVILYHLGNDYRTKDYLPDAITKYLSNREYYLKGLAKRLKMSREDAKALLISIINGGSKKVAKSDSWLANFSKGCEMLRNKILTDNDYQFKSYRRYMKEEEEKKAEANGKKPKDKEGIRNSFVAQKVYELENHIIQSLVAFLEKKGFISNKDYILCFDGVCIPRQNNDMKLLEEALAEFKPVDKKGMPIEHFNLKIKPFEELDAKYTQKPLTHRDIYLSDDYYWDDFLNELLELGPFKIEGFLQKNLPRVCFMLNDSLDTIIQKKDKDNMFVMVKLSTIQPLVELLLGYSSVNGEPYIKAKSVGYLISYFPQYIKRYNSVVFDPFNRHGVKNFNRFTKLKATKLEKANPDLIQPILYHIKECWVDGNEEHYNYFLNWFRQVFTTYKAKKAIVLYSLEQQIGKGMLINNFLIPLVFGSDYGMSVVGLSSATDKFNSLMLNRLFINLDETSCLENVRNKSAFDVLKKRITDTTIEITAKYKDTVITEDYSNYIITTNNLVSLNIEQGDNRYFVPKVSTKFQHNEEYFNKLSKSFTQEVADHFYTWILERPEASIERIPMTAEKLSITRSGLSNAVKFLIDVKTGEYKIDEEDVYDGLIKATILYAHFKKWTEQGGERLTARNMFGSQISPTYIQKKRRNDGIYYNLDTLDVDKFIGDE
jgi:hypothetical protein